MAHIDVFGCWERPYPQAEIRKNSEARRYPSQAQMGAGVRGSLPLQQLHGEGAACTSSTPGRIEIGRSLVPVPRLEKPSIGC